MWIVNPKVLENCNINSDQYSGLAFGLGIERIAMLKYGVSDIRDFYKSNLRFSCTILMKILFSHLKKFLPDE